MTRVLSTTTTATATATSSTATATTATATNEEETQQHRQQNNRRVYTLQDVNVLDLVCHATWVFDITNKRFWYGNNKALQFWKADTLKDFINRSFDDMSDSIWKKNLDNLERLKNNETWAESWTFYPNNGKPVSVSLKCSAIYIKLDNNDNNNDSSSTNNSINNNDDNNENNENHNGHLCMFCEAIPAEEEKVSPDFLRGAAMLRYLPISVSQFDANSGKLMHQNPEACSIFGTTTTTTGQQQKSSSSSDDAKQRNEEEEEEDSLLVVDPAVVSTTKMKEVNNRTINNTTKQALRRQVTQDDETNEKDDEEESPRSSSSSTSADDEDEVMTVTTKVGKKEGESSSSSSSSADSNTTTRSCHTDDKDAIKDSSEDGDDYDDPSNHFLSRFVDRKLAHKLLKQIKAGQDVSVEALVHTKSGPEWNAIHARLAMDAVSEDPVILYTARDISEIINAKKELQVNLERAEFFAIMAHEIRTPLFQVTGFIDLLDETELTKDQRDFIKLLRSAASSLMTVINDTLDYSKLEAGKMKLDIVPFEPKAVVDGSMAAITPSAEEKGIKLKINFNRNYGFATANGSNGNNGNGNGCIPVKLMGDPNRLRQVLLNLLQNAIKFTHKGSIEASVDLVTACTTANGSGASKEGDGENQQQVMLRFSVKDTGIGISKDHMNNIFRKYTQAAASIATSYGGTGLGLSICKSLVECMGGMIGVDSILGQGSTFWFQIPFDKVPIPKSDGRCQVETASSLNDTTTAAAAASSSSSPKLKVLVAEDNGVSRKMISKMLSSLGHDVTIVENGQEAVNQVELAAAAEAGGDGSSSSINNKNKQYDLILMDIQMPVMDGIDATKHIRSMGHTQIPIVGLTASVRRGDFQNIGLDDWIGKPVRLKELQKKLSGYFDNNGNYNNAVDGHDNVVIPVPPAKMKRNVVAAKSKSATKEAVVAAAYDGSSSNISSPVSSNSLNPPPKRRRISIEKASSTENRLASRSLSVAASAATVGTGNM